MDAKNLTWDQVKELAQIAMDNQNEFHLDISKDGDVSIEIYKPYNSYYPITTTTPITINTPLDDKQNWKPYVTWEDNNTGKINSDINYTRVTC